MKLKGLISSLLFLTVTSLHADRVLCPLPTCEKISSPFTEKVYSPISKKWRQHLGIDFAVKKGTPVTAVKNSVVIQAGKKGGYGLMVILQHKNGLKSQYAHLSKILVKTKQTVKQGDVIGHSGQTGLARGPLLHFALFKKGKAIDPLPFILKQ